MATTGVVHAKLVRIYVDVASVMTPIGCLTDVSFSLSRDFRDTTCKDSTGDFRDVQPGLLSGEASFTGYYTEDTTNLTPIDMLTYLTGGTLITIQYTTDVTGDSYLEADGYIGSIEFSAGNVGDNAQFSGTISITGAVTSGTVA